ncbi:hypothetical protein A2635_01300 [Candidatus Peribacteria bacterium RIFCSPHIGHO2_01_FULL_51_9]|nr:MAG: hypothetical protein A2635_01300 [Candidatus Peribacteria bacterium RIFCSPHIGHO2_01_FULL_51_9]
MAGRQILAFGYHDQTAPRYSNLCKECRAHGYEIVDCHTEAKGLWGKYRDLWKKRRRGADILVMFPGQYLMPLGWLLTRLPRRKLVFDAFISLYDTLVDDRQKVSRWNPYAWFLFFVDWTACHLADEVLIDTEEHKKYFVKTFHLKPNKVRVVYLGTRDDLFYPNPSRCLEGRHEILFYGTYLPLQGIEYIIDAAKILQDKNFPAHFTLIGSGQTYPALRERAETYRLKNITFEPRIPYEELPHRIRAADLCLGIFGTTAKARRVIPHKVYDAVGCGIPIITADTPAIREKFADGKEVILCKGGDAKDLAEKIEQYFKDSLSTRS